MNGNNRNSMLCSDKAKMEGFDVTGKGRKGGIWFFYYKRGGKDLNEKFSCKPDSHIHMYDLVDKYYCTYEKIVNYNFYLP